jgi:hypothetical protein
MSKPMIFLCCLMSSSLKPTARPRCLRTYTIRAVPANTNDSVGWPWGLSRRVTGREGHGASTPWSPYYDNNILIYSYFIFFYIPYIGNNHPNWLIFFRGVETTNQYTFICLYHFLWFLMIVGLKLWVIYVVDAEYSSSWNFEGTIIGASMEVPWKYIAGIQPRLPTKPHMLLVTVGGITCQVAGFTLGGDRRCQGASKSIHHLTVNCGRIFPCSRSCFLAILACTVCS